MELNFSPYLRVYLYVYWGGVGCLAGIVENVRCTIYDYVVLGGVESTLACSAMTQTEQRRRPNGSRRPQVGRLRGV
eukprot:2060587-Prymnesium_polylepis.1